MTQHKKTIEETRDRDADLKTLADAFFRDLRCTASKKGKDRWVFEPQALCTDVSMAEFVLNELEYEEGVCTECGTVLAETDEIDDFSAEAREYAEGLWVELGSFMEQKWHDLHTETKEWVCIECGELVDNEGEEGPFVCEDCEESDEEEETCEDCEELVSMCICEDVEEDDTEEEEEDAEDEFCDGCANFLDDCTCDEEDE